MPNPGEEPWASASQPALGADVPVEEGLVPGLVPPGIGYVTLGKSPHLSELHLSQLLKDKSLLYPPLWAFGGAPCEDASNGLWRLSWPGQVQVQQTWCCYLVARKQHRDASLAGHGEASP